METTIIFVASAFFIGGFFFGLLFGNKHHYRRGCVDGIHMAKSRVNEVLSKTE